MQIQFNAGEACAWPHCTPWALGVSGNTAFSKPNPGSPVDVFISSFSTWEAGVWLRGHASSLWAVLPGIQIPL